MLGLPCLIDLDGPGDCEPVSIGGTACRLKGHLMGSEPARTGQEEQQL